MKKIVIYHLETKLYIPVEDENKLENIEYCDSSIDFARMGISCLGLALINSDKGDIEGVGSHILTAEWRESLFDIFSSPNVLFGGWQTHLNEDKLFAKNGLALHSEFDIFDLIRKATGRSYEDFYAHAKDYNRYTLVDENQVDIYLDDKQGAYYYQKKSTVELLDICQKTILVEAEILSRLLRGTLLDPRTGHLLSYEFPEVLINLGYG